MLIEENKNMIIKPNRKTTSKRKKYLIVIGAILLALILGAIIVVMFWPKNQNSNQTDGSQVDNSTKKATTVDNGGQPSKDSAPNANYTPPASNDGITLTASQSNDSVIITEKLVGYSDGTCTLTAANGAQTTTKTADVIFASDYSSCAGFAIPVSELGSGTWNITLSVLSGGVTTSKSTTIGVSP